jgi:hypothetical protein
MDTAAAIEADIIAHLAVISEPQRPGKATERRFARILRRVIAADGSERPRWVREGALTPTAFFLIQEMAHAFGRGLGVVRQMATHLPGATAPFDRARWLGEAIDVFDRGADRVSTLTAAFVARAADAAGTDAEMQADVRVVTAAIDAALTPLHAAAAQLQQTLAEAAHALIEALTVPNLEASVAAPLEVLGARPSDPERPEAAGALRDRAHGLARTLAELDTVMDQKLAEAESVAAAAAAEAAGTPDAAAAASHHARVSALRQQLAEIEAPS